MKKLALAAIAACCAFGSAVAADYPTKPIRLVVPYAPGGGTDALARLIAQKLTEAWGQQVLVENRSGAGTTIGSAAVAKAPADGYTLLLSNIASHGVSPNLYRNPGYDPLKDFAPVTMVAVSPAVLAVHAGLPAKNLKELIALAKAKPDTLRYASGGNGSTMHTAAEIFKQLAGIQLVHVPYNGAGPAHISMIAGETDIGIDSAASILPHVQSGKLRGMAIARSKRLDDLPDMPTFAEAGLPGYEANGWYSVHTVAGTPPDIVAKLNREIVRTLNLPDVKQRLRALGSDGAPGTPEQLNQYVKLELAKYARVVKDAGIKIE